MARKILYSRDPQVEASLRELINYNFTEELDNFCEENGLNASRFSEWPEKEMLEYCAKNKLTGHIFYHLLVIDVGFELTV